MSRHVILAGTARGPPTFVAGACAVNVRDSFVPSSSVTETVVGPACDGAAVVPVPQAGRAIGAGVKQTCVTLRAPALETSANRTSPAWKLDERPPAKIAWIRSDGDCDCADATAGLTAAPAIRAPTTARMAVGRKGAPSLRGTVRLLPLVTRGPTRRLRPIDRRAQTPEDFSWRAIRRCWRSTGRSSRARPRTVALQPSLISSLVSWMSWMWSWTSRSAYERSNTAPLNAPTVRSSHCSLGDGVFGTSTANRRAACPASFRDLVWSLTRRAPKDFTAAVAPFDCAAVPPTISKRSPWMPV